MVTFLLLVGYILVALVSFVIFMLTTDKIERRENEAFFWFLSLLWPAAWPLVGLSWAVWYFMQAGWWLVEFVEKKRT